MAWSHYQFDMKHKEFKVYWFKPLKSYEIDAKTKILFNSIILFLMTMLAPHQNNISRIPIIELHQNTLRYFLFYIQFKYLMANWRVLDIPWVPRFTATTLLSIKKHRLHTNCFLICAWNIFVVNRIIVAHDIENVLFFHLITMQLKSCWYCNGFTCLSSSVFNLHRVGVLCVILNMKKKKQNNILRLIVVLVYPVQ